ncbi:MAG: cob(I)yrinic acid a,c-diamide adenosyltransferase [Candidatus Taylorbacteria bacterium CG10_big_fil_rev_8_21_14_0_10_41_48]|uniref:Cob(I)yrinic acid a,c-diamide adenosyltransferase n=1 Tax=Candidatus Taylorbacteria bacterium CG10_big_fil_rev_8_21_14_0_10_41_48 TaxID=1975024 RepID=A0A2M8LBF9_9BACT|nr:MAG: cob(I)yrinic acid a,c-diamide adenosyltransferase [Candidatus Taylorbacteria bacterium CG10_big_fil_rev_8_21_14_0_10_41_48]
MIIILTGDGKGKTTAALGQALRFMGTGKRALMVKFIKGPWLSGEDVIFEKLAPQFEIVRTGKGFVGIGGDKLTKSDHKEAARVGMILVRTQAETGAWHMVILDEILNAVNLKLVTLKTLNELIDFLLTHVEHIIITGRNCPESLIERADIVTEMKEIKHPFKKGVLATKGIEY